MISEQLRAAAIAADKPMLDYVSPYKAILVSRLGAVAAQ
jgi:hypothetical protein